MNPFTYRNTGKVGIYTIAENGKERYFTVNLADESESDINAIAIENLPDRSESTRVAQKISARQPLWMIFVFMVCMTLVLEWYSWLRL